MTIMDQTTKPVTFRLDQDIDREIGELSKQTGLSRADLMRMILAAGAKAIAANGYKFQFPLKFSAGDEVKTMPATLPAASNILRESMEKIMRPQQPENQAPARKPKPAAGSHN